MKNIVKYSLAAFTFFSLLNCEKDSCEYPDVCQSFGNDTQQTGLTVVTYHADQQGDFVGAIYDTRNNISAPTGVDWAVPLGAAGKVTHPTDWTVGKIGRVFGIAIDSNANIYLASSGVYNQYFNGGAGLLPYVNPNVHRIYKANAGTYSTSTFVDLPSSGATPSGSLNGIGNIAFDKVNRQLFATNLDDGKIYRISMTGTILQSYDPWTPDTGSPDITLQDEQIWGVGVNYEEGKVKVYFARITATVPSRNLYSITLDSSGNMPSTAPVLEIANLPGTQAAITDIEFSADTRKIILAERGHPHSATTFSYNRGPSSWLTHKTYIVGQHTVGKNSAGGVAFGYRGDDKNANMGCQQFVWASGNAMIPATMPAPVPPATYAYIYGIQGINYAGNTFSSSPINDLFIDFDPLNYRWDFGIGKGEIGDVDVFDSNSCYCVMKK